MKTGREGRPLWRCLVCGELIDPVLLINRMSQPKPEKKFFLSRLPISRERMAEPFTGMSP